VLYVIVPWIGVMMAGYGFGLIMQRDAEPRNKFLVRLGLGMTVAWFALGTTVLLVQGAPTPRQDGFVPPFWMRLLNQQKYPASQLFLLMTLGPAIALLPSAEQWKSWFGRALEMFGRVPMWYYMMHLLVIHTSAIVVNGIRTGTWSNA